MSNETSTCAVCDKPHYFRWTDTHGIGACIHCGLPYRIYHYEGEGAERHRVEKAPEVAVEDWYIPFARRYWQEVGRNVAPGCYNFPGSSYEVATREDADAHREWMEAHEAEIETAHASAPTEDSNR